MTLKRTTTRSIRWLLLILILASPAPAGTTEELPDSQATLQAMVDEISRSMRLQMEDLDKPYFIQYTVDDDVIYTLSAAYGTITSFDRNRSRRFFPQPGSAPLSWTTPTSPTPAASAALAAPPGSAGEPLCPWTRATRPCVRRCGG